jgi:hypothetical protein
MGVGSSCCCRQNITKSLNLIDNNQDNNGNEVINADIGNKIININQNNNTKILKRSNFGNPDIIQPHKLINVNQEFYLYQDYIQYEDMWQKLENSQQDIGSELS